jgi:hypothetical protein
LSAVWFAILFDPFDCLFILLKGSLWSTSFNFGEVQYIIFLL